MLLKQKIKRYDNKKYCVRYILLYIPNIADHFQLPVCKRRCFFSAHCSVNPRLHWVHWNGRSPLCRRTWHFHVSLCRKHFAQNSHFHGRSPVCRFTCNLNWDDVVNFRPQKSQEYGFSPVWMRICSCRLPFCEKLFWHTLQLYGLWPVCHLQWDNTQIFKKLISRY